MDRVLVDVVDGVADVRLNRPDTRNAVDEAMFTELLRAGFALRAAEGLRCVVLSGAGAGFCSGLDRSAFGAMHDKSWRPADADEQAARLGDIDGLTLGRSQRCVLVWQTLPVPVIAAVHGAAVGFGLQLALGADLRLVSPDARFAAAESNWGLAPDSGGGFLLTALAGPDHALDLIVTGRLVGAEEALRIGIATEVVADPYTAAHERAAAYASRSPGVLRAATRLVRMAARGRFQDVLLAERDEMHRNVGSPNQQEAAAAAREGRPPQFSDEPPNGKGA